MSMEAEKKTKFEIVAEAYACGFETGGQVAEVTDVKASTAATYLTWLRKAGGDPISARKLLIDHMTHWRKLRYRSNPQAREAELAASRMWHRRQRQRVKLAIESIGEAA